ncbi:hypothetical protein [Saccharomonospora halophila]|uniref:hypothetical protein n=1 Tax=Saccharomonospora halophila TaxID=129922 RepID=UPI00039C14B3|nr:hypothetical protein [Saccharomonospora halophila]
MVTKRLKPAKLLAITRRRARKLGYVVEQVNGRGKGSHLLYVVRDEHGDEVARFALTGHARELSWTVMRSIEDSLAHLLGEHWLEEQ